MEENTPVDVPAKFRAIIYAVEQMSVIDLHELVKTLEKKFGVSAAAVAAPAGQSPLGGADEAKEEKSTFTVELSDAGAQKIAVIKIVKEVLALGLKEAKDKVDGAPTVLKEGVKKADAEEMKKKIETAGGKVTLK
jgi:large subunit ribosomal protein L7/L12